MKSKMLSVLVLAAATSGAAVLAQHIPATAPTANAGSGTAAGDDFETNRRACLQQARQTEDPQERQRLVQRCQQDFSDSATAMPAPTPVPQIPDAAGSTANAPDSVATPTPPEMRTDPAQTRSSSEMSVEDRRERREQRQLRREQRRLARQQAMQTGELDDTDSNSVSYRGGRQRAWLAQGGGNYGRAESPGIDDDSADEPAGSSDFGARDGSGRAPRAGNWRGDNAGSAARGQRIQRLERRLEVIEGLLRQVLANQRQLLKR